MKLKVCFLLVTVVGVVHCQWRTEEDFESTTSGGEEPEEDDYGTVGSCTKTKLNVDIQTIDYAWSIQELAKYMRSVGVETFLSNDMMLNNSLEFDYKWLIGEWKFQMKTWKYQNSTMQISVSYNSTQTDIQVQPKLILRAGDAYTKPCATSSFITTTVEKLSNNYNNYDSYYFVQTTRAPPKVFYAHQTQFTFYIDNLQHLLKNRHDNGTSRRTSDDLDLVFKITTIKKDPGSESTLITDCDQPSYKILARKLMKQEFNAIPHNGESYGGGSYSPKNPTGGTAGAFGESNKGFMPQRYSYSTPTSNYSYPSGYMG